jgi:hypothetical protein
VMVLHEGEPRGSGKDAPLLGELEVQVERPSPTRSSASSGRSCPRWTRFTRTSISRRSCSSGSSVETRGARSSPTRDGSFR